MAKITRSNKILFDVMKQHKLSFYHKGYVRKTLVKLAFDRIKRIFRK